MLAKKTGVFNSFRVIFYARIHLKQPCACGLRFIFNFCLNVIFKDVFK